MLFGINAQKLVKACSVTLYNATFLHLIFFASILKLQLSI